MSFSGAVLGSPIQHSLSPVLYRAAFVYLGLTGATFEAVELTADQAIGYWEGLTSPEGRGFAVTMPLKESAATFADRPTEVVVATGAANTLVCRDGIWLADNTDVAGICAVADEHTSQRDRADSSAVWWVFGAGATARSAVAAAALSGVHQVVVISRRKPDAQSFERCVSLASNGADSRTSVVYYGMDDHPPVGQRPVFVVSTVPGGAASAMLASPWWSALTRPAGSCENAPVMDHVPVLDVAYNPWPSELAKGNAGVVSGLEMLIHQAVHQMRVLLQADVPVQVLREAVLGRT